MISLSFDKPAALAVGDFNNDCRPDLAVLTAGNGALAILLNSTSKPPLEIVGVELNTNVLWPANHKMGDVTVDYGTTNTCGPVACSLSVMSNEPINGTGDGDSAPDWEIIDEHHIGSGPSAPARDRGACTRSLSRVATTVAARPRLLMS
jgi:hypothetical protein